MPTEIAIVDPAPCFRDGLSAGLRSVGLAPCQPAHPERWARLRSEPALLMTVEDPPALQAVARIREQRPGAIVTALVASAAPSAHCAALRSGASATVARHAATAEIVAVVQEALRGRAVLPVGVARALAASSGFPWDGMPLTRKELEWLTMLARGATVRSVARHAGYSERQMFRLLDEVYRRVGARNRAQALMQMARMDLTDPAAVPPALSYGKA